MSDEWNNPDLAKAYAEKLDNPDWFEHEVNMPSLLSLMPTEVHTLLDFGCGPGQFTAELAAKYPMVEGADSSPAMVELVRNAYPAMAFYVWDGQAPLEDSKTYDVIFTKLTLQFVKDLSVFAHHARALLRSGGSIVFSVPHPLRTVEKVEGRYSETAPYETGIGAYGLHVTMIHRSLEAYIKPFVENGYVLTGLQEPRISADQAEKYGVDPQDALLPKRLNIRFTAL